MGMRTWCGENEAFGRSQCVGSISPEEVGGNGVAANVAVLGQWGYDSGCPASFPHQSTGNSKICYNDKAYATAGSGPCGSWCTTDVDVGSGCGDDYNKENLCASTQGGADFRTADLQKCKAKCAAAGDSCVAVSYREPSSDDANRPNCLPVFGQFEGATSAASGEKTFGCQADGKGQCLASYPTGLTSGVDPIDPNDCSKCAIGAGITPGDCNAVCRRGAFGPRDNRASTVCPPSFPHRSSGASQICYNDAAYATAASGPCGSWCTTDVNVGSGCGDNNAHLCGYAGGGYCAHDKSEDPAQCCTCGSSVPPSFGPWMNHVINCRSGGSCVLSYTTETDYGSCQTKCAKVAGCRAWTYRIKGGLCWVLNGYALKEPRLYDGYISGAPYTTVAVASGGGWEPFHGFTPKPINFGPYENHKIECGANNAILSAGCNHFAFKAEGADACQAACAADTCEQTYHEIEGLICHYNHHHYDVRSSGAKLFNCRESCTNSEGCTMFSYDQIWGCRYAKPGGCCPTTSDPNPPYNYNHYCKSYQGWNAQYLTPSNHHFESRWVCPPAGWCRAWDFEASSGQCKLYAAGSIGDEKWIKTPQPASGHTSGAMARADIANVPKTMWDPSDGFTPATAPPGCTGCVGGGDCLAYCQFHGRASGYCAHPGSTNKNECCMCQGFAPTGWECWQKGDGPYDAGAVDDGTSTLRLTLASSDESFDGVPMPEVTVVTRTVASLVISSVATVSCASPLSPPSARAMGRVEVTLVGAPTDIVNVTVKSTHPLVAEPLVLPRPANSKLPANLLQFAAWAPPGGGDRAPCGGCVANGDCEVSCNAKGFAGGKCAHPGSTDAGKCCECSATPQPPPSSPMLEVHLASYQEGVAKLEFETVSKDGRFTHLPYNSVDVAVTIPSKNVEEPSRPAPCGRFVPEQQPASPTAAPTESRPAGADASYTEASQASAAGAPEGEDPFKRAAWFQPEITMVQPPLEPPPRWGSSLVGKRGKFFVFGGAAGPSGGGGLALDDVWELDVARGTFRGPLDSPANKEREENRGATAGDTANLGFDDDTSAFQGAGVAVGPYKDSPDAAGSGWGVVGRPLPYGPLKYGFTSDSCASECKGFEFYALQDGSWCGCGNDLAHATRLGAGSCGTTGGSWCNYVYRSNKEFVRAAPGGWASSASPNAKAAYGEQYVVKSGAGAFGDVASQNGGYFVALHGKGAAISRAVDLGDEYEMGWTLSFWYSKRSFKGKKGECDASGCGLCLNLVSPSDCPASWARNLPTCDRVGDGELCEGDGECGTDGWADNCGGWDIYRRMRGPLSGAPLKVSIGGKRTMLAVGATGGCAGAGMEDLSEEECRAIYSGVGIEGFPDAQGKSPGDDDSYWGSFPPYTSWYAGAWSVMPNGCQWFGYPPATRYNRILYNRANPGSTTKHNTKDGTSAICGSGWCVKSYSQLICSAAKAVTVEATPSAGASQWEVKSRKVTAAEAATFGKEITLTLANTDSVSGTSAPCSLFGYCRTVFVDSVRITLQGKPPLPVPAARHGHAAADAGSYMAIFGGRTGGDGQPAFCYQTTGATANPKLTWGECRQRALAAGAPHFMFEHQTVPTWEKGLCTVLTARALKNYAGVRRPIAECGAARDAAGHAMGGKYRGAVYNLTMHKNATYLSDVWLWRYPQLPHEDGVEMLSRDGRPREGIGVSPPW